MCPGPVATILPGRGRLIRTHATRPETAGSTRTGREALAVGIVAFAAFVLLRGTVLHDPPYWDALLGLFPQAHWQAVHGLNPLHLLREQPGYVEGGACVYPFSVVPPLIALLERALPDAAPRFALLHLATFALAGVACAATYQLVRPFGRTLAWLAAAALWTQPGFQSLACQLGLEMPIAAAVAVALAALAEKRWGTAFVAALVALLVKPTGIVVAATALAVYVVRRLTARGAEAPTQRERNFAIGQALLLVLFAIEIGLLRSFERGPPGAGLFAGLVPLFAKRLWTVPAFGLSLMLVALFGIGAFARRSRVASHLAGSAVPAGAAVPAGSTGSTSEFARSATFVGAVFLVAYLGLLAQWQNPLPRYFVLAYPAVFALLVVGALHLAPRAIAAPGLAAVALFGLVDARGMFQPDRPGAFAAPGESVPLAAHDGWLLERSLRFRDGLALDLELARFAETRPRAAFVAAWPLQQALLEPAFGYVTQPVVCACAETSVAWTEERVPSIAELRASGREVLWILTAVDFAGAASQSRPGDVVVARFAVGGQRAFVVRRADSP